MFKNQFISVIEPDTKLGKGMISGQKHYAFFLTKMMVVHGLGLIYFWKTCMLTLFDAIEQVLHKDYLLGASYHGNDSLFLLNCYGVRWQVEVKCLFSNIMSLVGPVWAEFVMHNITNDITMLHFIKEVKDIFYVATYNKCGLETLPLQFEPNAYPTPKSNTVALFVNDKEYKVYLAKLPSVNALYCLELIVFCAGWSSMMDELAIQPDQFFAFTLVCKGGFNLTVFNKFREALTVCENHATYVLQNASCHIEEEPDYDVERMGWICNWRWHTTHVDEHRAFYKKLTPEVLKTGRIFVVSHKVHGYSSAAVSHCHKKFVFKLRKRAIFEMFLTPTLRCMKDRSGFWTEQ
nr:hypothetical protein [Tanacetum cinerariifolium]